MECYSGIFWRRGLFHVTPHIAYHLDKTPLEFCANPKSRIGLQGLAGTCPAAAAPLSPTTARFNGRARIFAPG